MKPGILSPFFPNSFNSFTDCRKFFHGSANRVGKNCERIILLYFNVLSLLYIFFQLFHNNNNNEKRKCLKNKGMVNILPGGYAECCERGKELEYGGQGMVSVPGDKKRTLH